jgi:hypothetical protein
VPFAARVLGYNFLVQLYFGLRILMLGMEYAALIALRIREVGSPNQRSSLLLISFSA